MATTFDRYLEATEFASGNAGGSLSDRPPTMKEVLEVLTGVRFYRDFAGLLCAERDGERVAGPNSNENVTYWSVLRRAAARTQEGGARASE